MTIRNTEVWPDADAVVCTAGRGAGSFFWPAVVTVGLQEALKNVESAAAASCPVPIDVIGKLKLQIPVQVAAVPSIARRILVPEIEREVYVHRFGQDLHELPGSRRPRRERTWSRSSSARHTAV